MLFNFQESKVELIQQDNFDGLMNLMTEKKEFGCIYADMVYENLNLNWLDFCCNLMSNDGTIIVQTDFHSVCEVKNKLEYFLGKENFVNWLIYIQEWGGSSKRYFPRKHDDILVYSKSKNYKFYPERIQIPKKTAGTGLDKNNKPFKTPCDVFYDLGNFSTLDKERVKLDGKNIQWQKPYKLMNRLLKPFTDPGDNILDPFAGSGTTLLWSGLHGRNCLGFENDKDVFEVAKKRLEEYAQT